MGRPPLLKRDQRSSESGAGMKHPSPVKTQAAPGGNATGGTAPAGARSGAFVGGIARTSARGDCSRSRGAARDGGATTRVRERSAATARGFFGPDRAFFWRGNSLRSAASPMSKPLFWSCRAICFKVWPSSRARWIAPASKATVLRLVSGDPASGISAKHSTSLCTLSGFVSDISLSPSILALAPGVAKRLRARWQRHCKAVARNLAVGVATPLQSGCKAVARNLAVGVATTLHLALQRGCARACSTLAAELHAP